MKVSTDSLLYWYPKIKSLDIPQPETEVIVLAEKELRMSYEGCPKSLTAKVRAAIDKNFELPVFLRSDLSSAKHGWETTCFYDGSNELWAHIFEIIQFNLMADIMGLPFKAIVVREFIPMDSAFTAFHGNMPVNPERRYFIDDGKVLCRHAYWIEDAIAESTPPDAKNWRELSKKVNAETKKEVVLLTNYSQQIASIVDGFWSIDFCRAKDGRWVLIDMATGGHSWHPDDCPHNQTIRHDFLKDGPNAHEFIEVTD